MTSITWPLPILLIQLDTVSVNPLQPNKKSRAREKAVKRAKEKKKKRKKELICTGFFHLPQRIAWSRTDSTRVQKLQPQKTICISLSHQQHYKTIGVELTKHSVCPALSSHNITLKTLLYWLSKSGNILKQRYALNIIKICCKIQQKKPDWILHPTSDLSAMLFPYHNLVRTSRTSPVFLIWI